MNAASSEPRKAMAAAMSSGSPMRPTGVRAAVWARYSAGASTHRPVSTAPGATALTRIRPPYSTASCRTRAVTPPLAAA